MSSAEDLQQSIQDLISHIHNANERIHEGTIVELARLGETADALCQAVGQLTSAEAQMVKPQMAELISSLDMLEQSLQIFKDEKQREIEQNG